MRSHWETSEKPIYVRTVWINGVRHAILSKNDPLLHGGNVPKRPYSCGNIDPAASRNKKRLSSNYNRSISISTSSSNVSTEIDTGIDSLESPSDIEYECRFEPDLHSDEGESEDKTTARRKKIKYKKIKLPNVNAKSANHRFSETQTENYNNNLVKNNFINPITERVLNWLDLASKETNYGDNSETNHDGNIEDKNGKYDENVVLRRVSTDAINNSSNEVDNVCNDQYSRINDRNKYQGAYRYTIQDVTNRHQEISRTYQVTPEAWRGQPERNSNADVNNQQNERPNNINEFKVNIDTRQVKSKAFQNQTLDTQTSNRLVATPTNSAASNITFNFQTISNTTRNCADKVSPCSTKIRQNNEAIRRNNENITRLASNIEQFKRNNEIVAHTFRHGKENNDKSRDNVHRNNVNSNLNRPNSIADNSNTSEVRTKSSRHKKGHRKSKSHKKYSSSNEDGKTAEESEQEYPSDEDINDTFR